MHTSIAVCLMMVGGYIYPECEVATVPLKDDLTRPNPIQDQEWKERVKRVPLPQVPSIDVSSQAGDNRAAPYRYNPNLMRPQQQPFMPSAPTQEGPGSNGQTGINGQAGYGPAGNNGQAGYGPAGGANPAANYISPNATAPGQNPVYGRQVPVANVVPTVNNLNYNNSMSNLTNQYGLGNLQNPMLNPSVGGTSNKPFNDYQRPTGYSPWQNLYLPSNNGTVDPYTAYVRPAMDQQNFNSHVSEQINGVRTRGYYGDTNTPGMEMNTGSGNGLVNPGIMRDYRLNPMNANPYNPTTANPYYPTY
jgi:hypothetical protein